MYKIQECAFCKKQPQLVRMYGIYYVQCPCGHYDLYEFCGVRQYNAIHAWNVANTRREGMNG